LGRSGVGGGWFWRCGEVRERVLCFVEAVAIDAGLLFVLSFSFGPEQARERRRAASEDHPGLISGVLHAISSTV
jgi:hypothetical protein